MTLTVDFSLKVHLLNFFHTYELVIIHSGIEHANDSVPDPPIQAAAGVRQQWFAGQGGP